MGSIFYHVSVGVSNLPDAGEFYNKILQPLGISRAYEIPGEAIAYGKHCDFWINVPLNIQARQFRNISGSGSHIAFKANTIEAVDNFHAAAMENGAESAGAPGYRTEYGENYYAAFIKDRDGNKIEAVNV